MTKFPGRADTDDFFQVGPCWADPPPLHQCDVSPCVAARDSLEVLLRTVEAEAIDDVQARHLLRACIDWGNASLDLGAIGGLDEPSWRAAIELLEYIRVAGKLRRLDFPDGGTRIDRACHVGAA